MQINEEQLKKFVLDGGLVSKTALEEISERAKEKNQKLSDVAI